MNNEYLERFTELALSEGFFLTVTDYRELEGKNLDEAAFKKYIMRHSELPKSVNLQIVIDSLLNEEKVSLTQEYFDSMNQNKSQPSVELVNFINDLGVKIFSDQFGENFIAPNGNGTYIIKLDSREFKNWLLGNLHKASKKIYNSETIENAKNILASQIYNNNNVVRLSVRTAHDDDGNFYYDLGNGRTAMINKDGWKILTSPPILFRNFKHQLAQPDPEVGGIIFDFLDLINVKDNGDEILLLVYIVSCFLTGFPHPVLVIHGQHGSAKSTLFRLLKNLIDPSALEIMPPVKKSIDFIQIVSHHWACFFDNLSGLKHSLSDDICRACTGGGFSKRALYTNDDDFIYDIQGVIGINGINNVVINPDLLDRSILIELARISENKRMTDLQIKEKFKILKPLLLGACFEIASRAIGIEESLKIDKLYRMADFTRWGYAIAEASGIGGKKFLEAYEKNIAKQNSEAIEASQIGTMVIEMLKQENGHLEAEPSYILSKLNIIADSINPDCRRNEFWPKDARWLSRRLNEISPNLEAMGIKIEFGRSNNRYIKISDTNNKNLEYFNIPRQ